MRSALVVGSSPTIGLTFLARCTMKKWTSEPVLVLARQFQPACVLAAAADLDLFDVLVSRPLTAAAVANKLSADVRGVTVLLDALVALQLLRKRNARYAVPREVVEVLTCRGKSSVLAMAQHQANCLRRWAQLAGTVKTGRPAQGLPSVRGATADMAAFIGAMDNISAPVANEVIKPLKKLPFHRLLDVGGASGTWTMALLRQHPEAAATLFDLPPVIPLARRRLTTHKFINRVQLIPGDFMRDPLPGGADLVWISAIIHQNSRAQNRTLFAKAFCALTPGGWVAIRDVLMEPDRTTPVAGALFAVNMLVATKGGGTFTFDEVREDLESAGFARARVARSDEGMYSIVVACKPGKNSR